MPKMVKKTAKISLDIARSSVKKDTDTRPPANQVGNLKKKKSKKKVYKSRQKVSSKLTKKSIKIISGSTFI